MKMTMHIDAALHEVDHLHTLRALAGHGPGSAAGKLHDAVESGHDPLASRGVTTARHAR